MIPHLFPRLGEAMRAGATRADLGEFARALEKWRGSVNGAGPLAQAQFAAATELLRVLAESLPQHDPGVPPSALQEVARLLEPAGSAPGSSPRQKTWLQAAARWLWHGPAPRRGRAPLLLVEGVGEAARGRVEWLELAVWPEEGNGIHAAAPEAFAQSVPWHNCDGVDEAFLAALDGAWGAARQAAGTADRPLDGTWQVQAWEDGDALPAAMLRGASGGAQAARGWACLLAGRDLDPRIAVTARVTAEGEILPLGDRVGVQSKAHAVGELALATRDRPGGPVLDTLAVCGREEYDAARLGLREVGSDPDVERPLVYVVNLEGWSVRDLLGLRSGRDRVLSAYLADLRRTLDQVPTYLAELLPGARLEEGVRVQVRVLPERRKEDPRDAEGPGERGYDTRLAEAAREQEQVRDWNAVRTEFRRAVLVGDPGMGKSWLLRGEGLQVALEALEALEAGAAREDVPFPIFCRLPDLAKALAAVQQERVNAAPAADLPEPLAEAIVRTHAVGGALPLAVAGLLRERLASGRVFFLLDALDEVGAAEARSALLAELRDWAGRHETARLLLTTRGNQYGAHDRPWPLTAQDRELELVPLDAERRGELFANFLTRHPGAAEALGQAVNAVPALEGLAQIPLLAGFLCVLQAEEWGRPAGERQSLDALRRTDLYRKILRRVYRRVHHEAPVPLTDVVLEQRMRPLERTALTLFERNRRQFTVSTLLDTAAEVWQPRDPDLGAEVERWTARDGLLIPTSGGEAPTYQFLHLTFQEYLAAAALARRLQDRKDTEAWDLVEERSWDPAWHVVLELTAGCLTDAPPAQRYLLLLTHQHPDGLDVFGFRLALAARCLPEFSADVARASRIRDLRDRITTAVFYTGWQHRMQRREACAGPLLDALAPAHRAGGRVPTAFPAPPAQLPDTVDEPLFITVTDRIAAFLADDDDAVRQRAAEAVGHLGSAAATPEFLAALAALLAADNNAARQHAAEAVGRLGSAAATPAVLAALAALLAAAVGWRAAFAVGRLGSAAATPAVLAALAALLTDDDDAVRQRAAEAVGRLGSAAATPEFLAALAALLAADDDAVRWRAAFAVGRLGSAAATPAVIAALAALLAADDDAVRWGAAFAVGRLQGAGVIRSGDGRWWFQMFPGGEVGEEETAR